MLPIFQNACTPISPEDAALTKFANAFSREIENQYGFKAFGVGGSIPVKIEYIDLSFYGKYSADVEQARKIVIPITLKFIQRMNEDEDLMKYLANSPASLKNIGLSIRFTESSNDPFVFVNVTGSRNLVTYSKYNEEHTVLVNLHRETFDEAERIVLQSSL